MGGVPSAIGERDAGPHEGASPPPAAYTSDIVSAPGAHTLSIADAASGATKLARCRTSWISNLRIESRSAPVAGLGRSAVWPPHRGGSPVDGYRLLRHGDAGDNQHRMRGNQAESNGRRSQRQ